jgi:hypothetical protein
LETDRGVRSRGRALRPPLRDLHRDVHGFAHRHGAGLEPLGERHTFEQFGDKKRRAIMTAEVVDREDVRMIQCRDRARSLLKAVQAFRIVGPDTGSALTATSRPRRVSWAR